MSRHPIIQCIKCDAQVLAKFGGHLRMQVWRSYVGSSRRWLLTGAHE